MRARLYLHIGLWCALFAVFLTRSIPIVGPALMENRFGPVEMNRSIDAYVRALTGIERGSERIPDTFRHVLKPGPLIIFVREEEAQSEFLGMMIGYISWPREVQLVKVATPAVPKELADLKRDSVAGLLFCSVNPPTSLEKRVRLGSNIVLVPLTETAP